MLVTLDLAAIHRHDGSVGTALEREHGFYNAFHYPQQETPRNATGQVLTPLHSLEGSFHMKWFDGCKIESFGNATSLSPNSLQPMIRL